MSVAAPPAFLASYRAFRAAPRGLSDFDNGRRDSLTFEAEATLSTLDLWAWTAACAFLSGRHTRLETLVREGLELCDEAGSNLEQLEVLGLDTRRYRRLWSTALEVLQGLREVLRGEPASPPPFAGGAGGGVGPR